MCSTLRIHLHPRVPSGGAAYTAGYSHKSADQMGEWAEGVSTMSQEVGQGVGAILGSVRDGFSQARSAPPPAPTITHVYHDRGSEKSSLVPILVVTAGGVTCYWVVCWYKGWDFFGMSHARTQELINNFNVSTSSWLCVLLAPPEATARMFLCICQAIHIQR